MAAPPPTPVTTHILNTVTGRPAANVRVTLSLVEPPLLRMLPTFSAVTNPDGRVLNWQPTSPISSPVADTPMSPASTDQQLDTLAGCFEMLRSLDADDNVGNPPIASISEDTTGGGIDTSKSGSSALAKRVVWNLKYDIGGYFEEVEGLKDTFWTEVDIRFKTDLREQSASGAKRSHWHIPLLLSPWSYTTYRGS